MTPGFLTWPTTWTVRVVAARSVPGGPPPPEAVLDEAKPVAPAARPTTADPGSAGAPGAKVDLNRATAAELEELPGVGPVLAQRILDWRTEHGRFASVDELGEVSGIGEKIFAQLQPKVTV